MRISADKLNSNNYVGVDNLLPERQGKTVSSYTPESGSFTGFSAGDVLIGNIRPYLKKIWLADKDGGTNGDVLAVHIIDDRILPRFLYQLLASDDFFTYNMQHSKGAKMPRGSKDAIMRYEIPIPPLEEQARIVDILDRFDALTNDITSGLPAEIAARKKQYEYYRDRLLRFEEVGV
jgi:type I restriction enzyme S subunit